MNLSGLIANIHWIPVMVMTVFSFALGAFWHTGFMFGKTWSAENNADKARLKAKTPMIFGGTAIMHFLAIAGTGAIAAGTGAMNGLTAGFLISVVWMLPVQEATCLLRVQR